MNNKFSFLVIAAFAATTAFAQQDRVTMTPAFPKRGDTVKITYHPAHDPSGTASKQQNIQLVFSYSNFYELPGRITMEKKGEDWYASLVVPRYGVYATFYLQNGEWTDKPSATAHYSITVYDSKNRRVENSYLYNGYSLPAQMGKAPGVRAAQKAMYEEELKNFPDNYEAQLRLLATSLNAGLTPQEEQEAIRKGNEVIARRFYADPYKMGNINRVTMGYLIMGENERLDSIRSVIVDKYPKGSAGIELRSSQLSRLDDEERLKGTLALLKEKTAANEDAFGDVHESLFDLYAKKGQAQSALQHARLMLAGQQKQKSPYIPVSYKQIAQTLLDNDLALDSAHAYASKALIMADRFPMGIIRYFPETGFLPSYISPKDREAGTKVFSANMLSLLALIEQKQGEKETAGQTMKKALDLSKDNETLKHAIVFYEKAKSNPQAAAAAWAMLLQIPNDTMALNAYRRTENADQLPARMQQLDSIWTIKMRASLNSERLNRKSPLLEGLVDMQGKPVDAASLQNKIVILNFWATWCVPCMEEMPYMQKVYTQYRSNPDVVFLVTNSAARNTLEDAQKWAAKKKFDFPVYFSSEPRLTENLGFQVIPATFVIDRSGVIQFRMIGFEGATIEKKLSVAIGMLL